jgi:hypothetical protein
MHTSPFKCFKTFEQTIILLDFLHAATTLFVARYISIWQAHYAFNSGDNKELQGLGW